MTVSGTIDAVDRDEVSNTGAPAWRVMVVPDTPIAIAGGDGKRLSTLAFHIARPSDPSLAVWAVPPLAHGDRLTLPMLRGGRNVPVVRADGSLVTVRMLGWVFDPDAALR